MSRLAFDQPSAVPGRECSVSRNERAEIRAAVRNLRDSDGEVRQDAAGQLWQILRERDEDEPPVGCDVIAALAQALADEDRQVRLYAAYALGCAGDVAEAAVPALATALEDPDADVADVAGYTLAGLGDPALPALAEAIRKGGQAARQAAKLFGESACDDEQTLPLVLAALQSEDPQVRAPAASYSSTMPEHRAQLAPLLRPLLKDRSALVRAAAIGAFDRVCKGDRGKVQTLTAAVRDRSAKVRQSALAALTELGRRAAPALPVIIERLDEPRRELREYYVKNALKAIGPRSVAALVEALQHPSPRAREAALLLLDGFDRVPIAPLLKALDDPDPGVRCRAAFAVGIKRQKGAAAVPILRRMLDAPESSVRAAAAHAIGYFGRRARVALDRLRELLADADPEVRWRTLDSLAALDLPSEEMAAHCLRTLQDPDGEVRAKGLSLLNDIESLAGVPVPVLVGLLDDDAPQVWHRAIEALAWMRDAAQEAVPALARLIRSKRLGDFDRLRAAEALWMIAPDHEAVVPVLVALLEKCDSGLSQGVCGVVCEIGPAAARTAPHLLDLIEHWPGDADTQGGASEALCAIGPEPEVVALVPEMVPLLRNSNTAAYVARVLGGLSEAVPELVKALRDRKRVSREWAADALGLLGEHARAAVPALKERLTDEVPEARWWAAFALASIDPPSTDVTLLTEALRDGKYDTRRRAATLLGDLGPAALPALPALQDARTDEDEDVRQRAAAAVKQLRAVARRRR